jgi:hypothetical protein
MLDLAKAIHEAIGIESPRLFIAAFAFVGLLIFAGLGWIVDRGYRVRVRQEANAAAVAVPRQTGPAQRAGALGSTGSSVGPLTSGKGRKQALKGATMAKSEPMKADIVRPRSEVSTNVVNAPQGIAISGGTVTNPTVNNYGAPPPQFDLKPISANVPDGGAYRSEFRLEVVTQIPVAAVRLTVYGSSIKSFDVTPQRTGAFMQGWSGNREGFSFVTLQSVHGAYSVLVTTGSPEQLRFEYDPDPR